MLEHPETISYEEVKTTITNIDNESDRALAAFAYGTGARVSEINQVTKADLFQEETGKYLYIYCPVLKKRGKSRVKRKALIRMDETWLITPILNYANSKLENETLFDFNRMYIYRHLIAATKWNPHGFRKLRATHLRSKYGFDAYQLQKFFAWSSIEPSGYYVGLDAKEIMY